LYNVVGYMAGLGKLERGPALDVWASNSTKLYCNWTAVVKRRYEA
jgi:hypothetical protein